MENPKETRTEATAAKTPRGVNGARVARDVVLIWLLSATGGFIAGVASGGRGMTEERMLALALANLLVLLLGFALSGALSPENKWAHLRWVAFHCWAWSIVNVLFFGLSLENWLLGLPTTFALMGLGGLLSNLLLKVFSKPT
jgi:hypothetical protein